MITENEFKETEIGLIPYDWAIRRISEIASIKYGKQKPKNEGRCPVIGSSGIYAYSDVPLINFETLIVGRKGNAGTVQLTLGPCWPADTTFYLEWLSEDVNVQFLYYFMSAHRLSGEHAKTTLPSVQRQDIENYLFPVPSIQEQSKIVMLMGKLQQAIEQQEKIIEKTKELKRSLMHRLFTYGLRDEELKESEIGLMPKSWRVVPLKDVFILTSGKTRPKRLSEITSKSKIYPAYGGNGIMGYSDEYLIDFMTLILGRVGAYCGCVHISYGKSWISDNALYAKEFLMDVNLDYLGMAVGRLDLNRLKNTGAQPLISQSIVYSQKIPLPPKSIQEEIADIIKKIETKWNQEQERKVKLEHLFKSMLNNLMTGQVRVKDIDFGGIIYER